MSVCIYVVYACNVSVLYVKYVKIDAFLLLSTFQKWNKILLKLYKYKRIQDLNLKNQQQM